MKKALLIIVVAIALVIWITSWFRAPEAVATSAAQQWPGGLGTLETVGKRYPPQHANDASRKLTALANALPKNEVVENFVAREIARGETTIGQSPTLPDVSAMRDLLLHEPVVWERIPDIGDRVTTANRVVQLTVARALVASALKNASWDDLHAVWNLAHSLDGQPQMMSQTAAFAMVRMINAVAWKMPLPPQAWFAELQQRDDLGRLLEAFQFQAWSYWKSGANMFPTKFLSSSIEHDRRIAEAVSKETRCDVTVPMNDLGVDVSFVWRRAFRYRAEREATSNALRVREGKPIETVSRCSDGAWTFQPPALRFSRKIDTAAPDVPMPLVLTVAASRQWAVETTRWLEENPLSPEAKQRFSQLDTWWMNVPDLFLRSCPLFTDVKNEKLRPMLARQAMFSTGAYEIEHPHSSRTDEVRAGVAGALRAYQNAVKDPGMRDALLDQLLSAQSAREVYVIAAVKSCGKKP